MQVLITIKLSRNKPVNQSNQTLRNIPSVNALIDALQSRFSDVDAFYLKQHILSELDAVRQNPEDYPLSRMDKAEFQDWLITHLNRTFRQLTEGSLKKAINATGVILHTGLGRAPLNSRIAEKLHQITRYTNLEINLNDGKRGERNDHLSPLLRILSGAEDGLAVNNNAAAVMLMLNTIGNGKEVILSRGEMIEIGGSFRLPEVMRISGCKLKEIGTTNKTHMRDYEQAISAETGGILICHPSNYEIQGFTQSPQLEELVRLGHEHNLPVVYDLGSGSLLSTQRFGSDSEPQIQQIVDQGLDLISFSGDKLLGGAQAGLIVGKQKWVQKCAENHLLRALRLDKFMIKLLQETLVCYFKGEDKVSQELDALAALTMDRKALKERSLNFVRRLPEEIQSCFQVVESTGKVGSGAYPTLRLPSFALRVQCKKHTASKLARLLRNAEIPVFTYIENDFIQLDLRAIDAEEETIIQATLTDLLK
ncbi:MAG: L-seryl-tRNA(Sec) selenium transferase [Caldithrix sp.]|nr:L-seryl-tRNA(Sec) selenium transferase [Caldithrix sp.]